MNCMHKRLLLLPPALLFCSAVAFGATPEPPAMPPAYVVDLAGVIRPDVQTQLNTVLRELEQKTTAQVIVLTVKGLDGESIDSFSLRMAERWKLGRKQKDNGVLISVAVNDRKYRLEVGYGLESILPDSAVGSIGREYLVPYFRKGDYSTGLYLATLAVVRAIAAPEGVEIAGLSAVQRGSGKTGIDLSDLFIILFIIGFVGLNFLSFWFRKSRRFRRSGWWGSGYYYGSVGSGGGSFGGGGFGGFGGGGGGSFGGGGASGSW